jgi:hypothetical protein
VFFVFTKQLETDLNGNGKRHPKVCLMGPQRRSAYAARKPSFASLVPLHTFGIVHATMTTIATLFIFGFSYSCFGMHKGKRSVA